MTDIPAAKALYPTRSAAGAMLGRQLYQRVPSPVLILGITPTGVEIAASAAKALGCKFDVMVAAHLRVQDNRVIGAMAEDADAVTDQTYEPGFDALTDMEEAVDRARRVIKTERLLFRGPRPLRPMEGINIVVADGHVTSPWKLLAAAAAAEAQGAMGVWTAAAVATQAVGEKIRARRRELVCPSLVMNPEGHAMPFGDAQDPSAERLKSIVVARQAA